jgi:hypothetical protein
MDLLSRASGARPAGIERGVIRSAAFVFLLSLAAACDVRPLTSAELYGGRAGTGGGGTDGGAAGTGVDAAVTVDAADASDAGADADASTTDGPHGCAATCAADQFCNELTGRCTPNAGTGMLSGMVLDACNPSVALDALVGIARQRLCSHEGKGSFFFTQLPLGTLFVTASKPGYEPYGAAVSIPEESIHVIRLRPIGGCDAPAPAQTTCVCEGTGCLP